MSRLLEIDGLEKRYGDVVALNGMAFKVQAGEIFGFVGGNGAGKTTTMRIALGVLQADAGEVRWDGRPVDLKTWRRVGYMPEERGLYPKMKVADQLSYLAELHGMSAREAAAASDRWTERLGIASRRDEEIQKLSLGNQQRVQLAAALVHDPDLLILDEPFSGLDPVAVDVMSQVLKDKAAEGIPVLFSSHQLELVEKLCDRVGIVSAGKMVANGSVEELQADANQQLVVRVDSTDDTWARSLVGVNLIEHTGDEFVFDLDANTDEQIVLRAAQGVGPVRAFTPKKPPLTELFREVVKQKPEEA